MSSLMFLYFFTKGNVEILCIPVPCNDYERWRAKKSARKSSDSDTKGVSRSDGCW